MLSSHTQCDSGETCFASQLPRLLRGVLHHSQRLVPALCEWTSACSLNTDNLLHGCSLFAMLWHCVHTCRKGCFCPIHRHVAHHEYLGQQECIMRSACV